MSCCGCNQTPCVCVPQCPENCPEVIDYSFENINLSGQGVLSGVSSSTVQFKGIRSVNANLVITNNAGMGTVDIELPSSILQGSVTFANAAARALTAPDFQGQYAVQLDTGTPYIATGTGAGDWTTLPWIILGVTNTPVDGSLTLLDLTIGNTGAATFRFQLGATGTANFSTGGFSIVNAATALDTLAVSGAASFADTVSFAGTSASTFGAGAVINFEGLSQIQVNGVAIPANSVFISSSNAGELSSALIANFLSTSNEANWTTGSGTESRVGADTYTAPVITNPPTQAEVQAIADKLEEISQNMFALLNDLSATLKPVYV